MKDFRLLVFDWDGTLMDSEAQIVSAMQAAMRDLDLEPLPARSVSNIIGLGLREAVNNLFPGRDDAFQTRFVERYRHHWTAGGHSPLFPGAEQTLRLLHEEGFLLAVATGKGRPGLDRVMHATGLDGLFHASRCADETLSKPHPRMLQEIMVELGVAPEHTLMIGDTEYDLEMANNAGAAAIAAAYGVHDWPRLERHRPLARLDHITELGDWLAESRAPGVEGVRLTG